jgi:lipopolysaccharide export system protein LptC
MDRTGLSSKGTVVATGPIGQLTAGAMLLSEAAGKAGTYVLVFNGGVRLIYEPKAGHP